MRMRISALLLSVAGCFLFASPARATDYAYGYTSVYVDGTVVRGYHRTEVDYNTDVYYRPYVCASLYKNGIEVVRACGGGFASATRNTQTPYFSGSSYSALTDHYVNIEYEEEDPYNPGYYYYSDVLGYGFSPSGSHPIDWYFPASGFYNQRPDESLHLGDTTAQVCSKPTNETTAFSRWAIAEGYPTTGMWSQVLLPATANFTGRTVTEQDPGGGGPDTCWFSGSFYSPLTSITGGYWTVTSNNTWQFDAVGPKPAAVNYYRAHNRTPCSVTVPQRMVINCSSGTLTYKTNWLGFVIGDTTVSSIREGIVVTRTWP